MKRIINFKLFSASPELPPVLEQPPMPAPKSRRLGKKTYFIGAAVIAIVIITAALFIPQSGAVIPLNVDYEVGEKMVYDTSITVSMQIGNSSYSGLFGLGQLPSALTMNAQQSIEVIDFDGEYYSLNHTTTMTLSGKPFSFSIIEKMNKTGYSTYILNLGDTQQVIPSAGNINSNSYLAQLLSKPEVRVGDSITIPYPAISPYIEITGDLTMKFGGIEDLAVPAGTYRVFRIDITSNNLKMNMKPPAGSSSLSQLTSLSMDIDIAFQIYMEYGTLRQIKSTMQETASYQSAFMNSTMQMSMDMTLNQHIKP